MHLAGYRRLQLKSPLASPDRRRVLQRRSCISGSGSEGPRRVCVQQLRLLSAADSAQQSSGQIEAEGPKKTKRQSITQLLKRTLC